MDQYDSDGSRKEAGPLKSGLASDVSDMRASLLKPFHRGQGSGPVRAPSLLRASPTLLSTAARSTARHRSPAQAPRRARGGVPVTQEGGDGAERCGGVISMGRLG
eukprot:6196982-Pleurochrysis_carterae.AAC.2